jgi:hypothetical protein
MIAPAAPRPALPAARTLPSEPRESDVALLLSSAS